MNIKQAKEEIKNTLRAYLTKDEYGSYLIPTIRQRPILLMGPPGIGKTQIMAQIASETGVGLVAYTITHHTRQSAIGLPFIEKRSYGGRQVSVTEYTMSEILASVYRLMEETGLREGILFLDEINCVSETLAPMMLQFLQCKTFGNQSLPEGWTIVAAGNPPEYNKSVRDFDVVTLDRVKRIDVTEDYGVWKEYANRKGIHGSILSYLDIKKNNFYRVETTVDGLQFATARGWEDLSELIFAYEKLGIPVGREVVGQYIQLPRIAKDFANYLALYYKYQRAYHVDEILSGKWPASTVSELAAAPFDERLSVMGLLLSRLSERARKVRMQDALVTALHGQLLFFRDETSGGLPVQEVLDGILSRRQEALDHAKTAGQMDKENRIQMLRERSTLERYRRELEAENVTAPDAAMDRIRGWFGKDVEERERLGKAAGVCFDHAFRFLEATFGDSQELVIFVTEITAGYDASWFVENFGCDAYFRHNRALMFDDTRRQIRNEITEARGEAGR
ncbi:MAG: AAA family ATPase [Intestinimonas sp.]|jgi:MoxR-like ATPase|nr:AAA family ATPase [Intestinimonas sp.]